MAGFGTYWRTARHLKPVQVYGRVRFRLTKPRPDLSPVPPLRAVSGDWIEPAGRRPTLLDEHRFCFLNETRELSANGWNDPAFEKLWTYNLHYFDDLNAAGAEARVVWHQKLLLRWVQENPPGVGVGWEPYPTSLRIVNWIKWVLAGHELPAECRHSLAVQARWLSRRLEVHLLGNHLLANAKGLVFAGLFFTGHEAERWLETGSRILEREIREQVLSDGGHFERSTMYHALILEDLLDLTNLAAAYNDGSHELPRSRVDELRRCVEAMRSWLAAMCHPDGEIAFFNDAAFGIAPSPRELDAYALRLGFSAEAPEAATVTALSATGYVRLENDEAVVLLDVAPVGPDYLPAHAHADTLCFELSLFGHRIIVNSGTSCYACGRERSRQRGTGAHNTVVLNGENSSEVWGSFRVGRRAMPLDLAVTRLDAAEVRCSHDGYRRLRGKPMHRRVWTLATNSLTIADHVAGKFERAEARFHLHPSIGVQEVRGTAPREVVLRAPGGQPIRFSIEGGVLRKVETTWHPEFGARVPTICLVADLDGDTLVSRIAWDEPTSATG